MNLREIATNALIAGGLMAALGAVAHSTPAVSPNMVVEFDGFGAPLNINGTLYPFQTITPGSAAMYPFAGGQINIWPGSLPGIFANNGEVKFIPENFANQQGVATVQPLCQFQLNYATLADVHTMQTLAGSIQNIFNVKYLLDGNNNWVVDVQFTYEADYNVTTPTHQAPWKLDFICFPKI